MSTRRKLNHRLAVDQAQSFTTEQKEQARTNLGLTPGTDVQAYDALLTAIAALSMVADRYIYGTGADTVALGTITSFARTLLDDASAATARTTLGEASSFAADGYWQFGSFIVQWGAVASDAGRAADVSVSFSPAFPTACRAAVAIMESTAAGTVAHTAHTSGRSTTGFTLRPRVTTGGVTAISTAGAVWIAVGN
jgi:hypothetical protein